MMKKWQVSCDDFIDNNRNYYGRPSKKYKLPLSDNIYVFDTEATSLFKINGVWQRFDYSITPEEYREIEKSAIPYIWMFGDENDVYYGREIYDFEDVLKKISREDQYKVIWVHNLAYDMVWLLNIFYEKYTITNVCARSAKHIIEFCVDELNIIFRCSYMLTNLSLDASAKEYTNVRKAVGDLKYNVERSPLTKLSEKQLYYCEMDCITLREVIKYYRNEYQHIKLIPLTSTGTVRKALKDHCGFFYIKKQQQLVPSPRKYLLLYKAFSGGYTHANFRFVGRHFKELIESQDIASSYPAVLCTEKYPCEQFILCNSEDFENRHLSECYAFLLCVHFDNVKSVKYNHYMQASKCMNLVNPVRDNGRIESCDSCDMIITDIDLDIIKKNYKCDYTITKCYRAKKDYLDLKVITFILGLYKNKTSLKGVDDMKAIYRRDKARLNSCFGMACTNQAKMGCSFENFVWQNDVIDLEYLTDKLDKMKDSLSTLFAYSTGVYCTAYARRNLMMIVLDDSIDKDIIYMDTDSIKFRNREKHQDIFMTYNLEMLERYRAVCEKYNELTLTDFMPIDTKGNIHPIGFYEYDGLYTEFKTLGAKKYVYRDYEDKELHLTLAGVSKKGVTALNDNIDNFKIGFVFDYDHSGKSTHYYSELHVVDGDVVDDLQDDFDFIDIQGNKYHSTIKWSIILQPTTYELGKTDIMEVYEDWLIDYERRKRNE